MTTVDDFEAQSDTFLRTTRHPTLGRDVILRAEQRVGVRDDETLAMAKDIVYTHHERWDGGGYPRGLSGSEIPVAGRVMALVSRTRCNGDQGDTDGGRSQSETAEPDGVDHGDRAVDALLARGDLALVVFFIVGFLELFLVFGIPERQAAGGLPASSENSRVRCA